MGGAENVATGKSGKEARDFLEPALYVDRGKSENRQPNHNSTNHVLAKSAMCGARKDCSIHFDGNADSFGDVRAAAGTTWSLPNELLRINGGRQCVSYRRDHIDIASLVLTLRSAELDTKPSSDPYIVRRISESPMHDGIQTPQLPSPTRRPHICFVAPNAWPVLSGEARIEVVGGAEVQQCILARLLVRNGYRVSMICLNYGQPKTVLVDNITVLRAYSADAGLPILRFLHPRLTGIWRAMREADADIYYQRSAGVITAIVAVFCRAYGKHSVYAGALDTDFVPGHQLIRYRRDRWLFERGLAAVDTVLAQNETQQRNCLEHYGRSAILIPSCYELPANASPGAGEYVLWVAMLRPHKRAELLLELARRLPLRRFVMIGGSNGAADAAYFEDIRNAAKMLPNVEFVGFLPLSKVEPYFDRARVVVNTSTVEGMPNIFLQAWARGVPTLAFANISAQHGSISGHSVVQDLQAAANEVERLFVDEDYWSQASAACREYFVTTYTHGDAL
ncbi:MAG TPA: glycosyltransferase family 4 protein, partial [Azonexus sp.]